MNEIKNNPMPAINAHLSDAQRERLRLTGELADLNANMARLRHAPLRTLDQAGEVAPPTRKEN
jgi:hypothetical protein